MDAKERIQQYINFKGISVYRLEADANMSKGYWSKTKSVSADVIMKISRVYSDISADWLLRGEGEMIKGASNPDTKSLLGSHPDSISYYEHTIERKEQKIEELTLMVGRLQHEVEMLRQDKKTALRKDAVLGAAKKSGTNDQ